MISCKECRERFVVAETRYETKDEPQQRKRFTKKTLKIASEAKEKKKQKQDGIDNIHTDGLKSAVDEI